MTERIYYDSKGYIRKLHPCPGCGKMKLVKGSFCRQCVMSQRREAKRMAEVAANPECIVVRKNGYKQTLYKCRGCGRPRRNCYGLCMGCRERKRQRKKAKMICSTCGGPVSKVGVKRCLQCIEAERQGLPYVERKPSCKVCGKEVTTRINNGHCSECWSRKCQDRLWQQRGELPLDRGVLAATEETSEVRRCPTCGGKITTKNCVKCTILGRIGEKGFV